MLMLLFHRRGRNMSSLTLLDPQICHLSRKPPRWAGIASQEASELPRGLTGCRPAINERLLGDQQEPTRPGYCGIFLLGLGHSSNALAAHKPAQNRQLV
jgi:hypothetical protein